MPTYIIYCKNMFMIDEEENINFDREEMFETDTKGI
jgi:hypothetical protein